MNISQCIQIDALETPFNFKLIWITKIPTKFIILPKMYILIASRGLNLKNSDLNLIMSCFLLSFVK